MSRIVHTPRTCGGRARIEGHRIDVALIVIYSRWNRTAAEIVSIFPSITEEDVEAAIAYYNRDKGTKDEILNDIKAHMEPEL